MDPNSLAVGTAAILAYSFAIQQVVELVDLLFFQVETARQSPWRPIILRLCALALGFVSAHYCKECALITVSIQEHWLRVLVTGFGLAGGTEGANSLLKFAKYAKENTKAEAAKARTEVDGQFELHAIQRQ